MATTPWRLAVGRRIVKRGVRVDLVRIVRNLLDVVSTVQVKVLDALVDQTTTLEQLEEVCGSVAVVRALVQEPAPAGIVESFILSVLKAEEQSLAKTPRATLVPHDNVELVRQAVQPCLEFLYYEQL